MSHGLNALNQYLASIIPMDDTPSTEQRNELMKDAVARARNDARKDGIFAGLSSGLAAAILGGTKLMGFNRNKILFSGVLTGILSGYLFTQAFTSSNLARLRVQEAQLFSRIDRDRDSALNSVEN